MKRIPIVIINSFYFPVLIGGAEISTKQLAELLANYFEVNIITVGHQTRTVKKEVINDITVWRLPINNIFWLGDIKTKHPLQKIIWHIINAFNIIQYKEIKNLLYEIKPALIHTQNLSGIGVLAWKLGKSLNIPVIHTLRDSSLLRPIKFSVPRYFLRKYNQFFSNNVDGVIGISNYILDEHLKYGFFKNAEKDVIFNSVDEIISIPPKIFLDERKKALSLGYFGRATFDKGVHLLIEAVRQLPVNIIESLIICGEGPDIEFLMKAANGDPRIKFKGKKSVEEIRKLMSQVDLTILPSIVDEAFGRVIIESYIQGTPVCASAIGGIPEIIIDKIFLFEPNSVNSLKLTLKKYYSYTNEQRNLWRNR